MNIRDVLVFVLFKQLAEAQFEKLAARSAAAANEAFSLMDQRCNISENQSLLLLWRELQFAGALARMAKRAH